MYGKPKGLPAKFDCLEHRRCEDLKGIVAPEIGPINYGTFEKQAPGVSLKVTFTPKRQLPFKKPFLFLILFLVKDFAHSIKSTLHRKVFSILSLTVLDQAHFLLT